MYPSDISQKKFETIRPILESARKTTRPRTLDLYEVFNGVLYVVSTGCQWRALPHDYPKWNTVHRYFQIWSESSILEDVLKKIGRGGAYQKWEETMHKHGYR